VTAVAAVEVIDLVRRFGTFEAVRGISFAIPPGCVLGFIGANGAGKTTTMRIMATLEEPTSGRVRIAGHDVVEEPTRVRRHVGWMPDSYGAYPHVTAWEYLDFYARAYGLTGETRRRRLGEILEFTDLGELQDREMTVLSKGMAQRLCLGRALIHDPDVLILDEPAAGLDPRARIEFKRLVRLLAESGKTLFISSHILSELEEMCDTLLFIDDGRVLHHGSAEALKRGDTEKIAVVVTVAGSAEPLRQWALLHPGVEVLETAAGTCRLRFDSGEPELVADRLRAMVQAGVRVVDFRREERRLEDAFVDALRKLEDDGGPNGEDDAEA
jgi:ABC-2 type transport system ATP-binding protein